MTSRKLQIFWFVLIEMFSPCFLNSREMSFLVRSDCGPLAFIQTARNYQSISGHSKTATPILQ